MLDDTADLERNGEFDADWYKSCYPDVEALGMDPKQHWLWVGRRMGRPGGQRPAPSSIAISSYDFDALFIDGTNGTSSAPYRVIRVAEGLANEGWKVRCIEDADLPAFLAGELPRVRFLIVHRAPFWGPYVELVERMRALGAIIIYDTDDFVFDESIMPFIDGVRYLSPMDIDNYRLGMRAYRQFILNADFCTTTTNFLAEKMAGVGTLSYRVRNAISTENIRLFEDMGYRRKGKPSPFVVGYYSGTKTHQADFAEAAPALARFMSECPDVVFRLVGSLDLEDFPEIEAFADPRQNGGMPRVTRVGLMQHDAMMRDQLCCDLIIAPLQTDNPYCEAKSELKFFEAALTKCPVIASSTRTFVEAMSHGKYGHLARTSDEWLAAFRTIYHDYDAALAQANRAFDYVRSTYSQAYVGREAKTVYEDFAARFRNMGAIKRSVESKSIAVIVPDFSGPSGGHRKIFTVCKALEQAGHRVTLHFYTMRAQEEIREGIARLFMPLDAEIVPFNGVVEGYDVVMCTHWSTVYGLQRSGDARVIYFVQDFEPMFSVVGSEYLRAMSTYTRGYETICYGKWVAAKLRDELDLTAKVIPFTLDHSTYVRPPRDMERDIDVLFYARPSQDRRCYALVIEGLAWLKHRCPDVRIGLFGEAEYGDLGFDYHNYGVFDDIRDLPPLYARSRVGICFSPTNPSQLGYEMIACGVCVVDVTVKFAEVNFDGDDFVTYCVGHPDSIATVCQRLLDNEQDRSQRQQAGYAFIAGMHPDEEIGRSFIRAAQL
ncbi:MAG TPA: hypothetical protein VF503_03880 [Sphingobium sp.]|uniref:rhamnosyltransferase WsaF family glycosyltransferase n=1 Tax=Sphingobium sp. TaxID=1912891 RepID=UPI002ED6B439